MSMCQVRLNCAIIAKTYCTQSARGISKTIRCSMLTVKHIGIGRRCGTKASRLLKKRENAKHETSDVSPGKLVRARLQ
jgi:hypothetical protein